MLNFSIMYVNFNMLKYVKLLLNMLTLSFLINRLHGMLYQVKGIYSIMYLYSDTYHPSLNTRLCHTNSDFSISQDI